MSASAKSLSARSAVTQQTLRGLGFTHLSMQISGAEIAKALREAEQEFNLRPRVTSAVHLLKFRTIMTRREVIVRYSLNRNNTILFRFIEHKDRFTSDGTTRDKVREIQFDLNQPNMARRIAHVVAYDVVPWLSLSAENLRSPSIRMPARRNTDKAVSRFLVGSFKITSHAISSNGSDPTMTVYGANRQLQGGVPYSQALLTRLQDPANVLYLVSFISGRQQILDEATFYREFIYIDEIDTSEVRSINTAALTA